MEHATAIWLEQHIAMQYREDEHRYFRAKPLPIINQDKTKGIAYELNRFLGIGERGWEENTSL